jgi:hypothetical protein
MLHAAMHPTRPADRHRQPMKQGVCAPARLRFSVSLDGGTILALPRSSPWPSLIFPSEEKQVAQILMLLGYGNHPPRRLRDRGLDPRPRLAARQAHISPRHHFFSCSFAVPTQWYRVPTSLLSSSSPSGLVVRSTPRRIVGFTRSIDADQVDSGPAHQTAQDVH